MKTTHLETVSNQPSKLFSRPFLPSAPQPGHTGWPVLPRTHPSRLSGFPGLFFFFFFAALFPKSEFLPHLSSHLQSHPVYPISVPWNLTEPASRNSGSLFHNPTAFSLSCSIHTYHALSSCFCLQLGIAKTWRAGWSHFTLYIWSLFLYCLDIVKSSKYCGRNKLKLKFVLPLKYSIILFSWASATY